VITSRISKKAERRSARKKDKTATAAQPKTFQVPNIEPRNNNQRQYLKSLESSKQVFALGPAGCGKTYIATHWAVQNIIEKKFTKFIITRPMVSSDSSENIGFLPGDLNTKFTPWALPIMDIISKLVGKAKATEWLRNGTIEFAPFQFMRGRTFDEDCVVMLDEAQNCNVEQIRLFLTRLGNCATIISGDPTPGQCDIRNSGLTRTVEMVQKYKINASICSFTNHDIVRSRLCQEWVKAFESELSK
jgi:phosphate starvation-inducible PhoH-like protein